MFDFGNRRKPSNQTVCSFRLSDSDQMVAELIPYCRLNKRQNHVISEPLGTTFLSRLIL